MKSNKIEEIVRQEMCTGCGVCVSESPDNLRMEMNEYGFLVPIVINEEIEENTLRVCPFNPIPEKVVQDEDKLSKIFLKDTVNYNTNDNDFSVNNTIINNNNNEMK